MSCDKNMVGAFDEPHISSLLLNVQFLENMSDVGKEVCNTFCCSCVSYPGKQEIIK